MIRMNTQKRLNYVDMVKGIAVVWIVVFHLIVPGTIKNVVTHLADSMLLAFFFYSGYFHKPGKRSIGENIRIRAKATLIPFFKYSVFFWVIGSAWLLYTKNETVTEALCCLRNFFAGCIWNRVIQGWFHWQYYSLGQRYIFLADFWFLLALFFASVLFFLIVDHVAASKAKSFTAVILLFAATGLLQYADIDLPYNIQFVPFWTAVMLLGTMAGQERLFEKPVFTGVSGWILSIGLLASGSAVSMWKAPSTNVFRGSFGEPEVTGMLLCIAAAALVIPGLSGLCVLAERSGMRTKELSWVGSHSLLFYLYHMFFAWVLCTITGFSLNYKEPVPAGVTAGSVLLILSCLGLVTLRAVIGDRISDTKRRDNQ